MEIDLFLPKYLQHSFKEFVDLGKTSVPENETSAGYSRIKLLLPALASRVPLYIWSHLRMLIVHCSFTWDQTGN